MENYQKKSPNHNFISGEKPKDEDFEFGWLTPSSPPHVPYKNNFPADHLFFNGRLLPHAFPPGTVRTISRTISEDSSRSNRTNSRSSSSSPSTYTPRTSTSSNISNITTADGKSPERKSSSRGKTVNYKNKETYLLQCKRRKATDIVTAQLYGANSQRWQHITAMPGATFKRDGSVKRGVRVGGAGCRRTAVVRGRKRAEEKRGCRVVRWWRRFIRAVVWACRECHAMEPEG